MEVRFSVVSIGFSWSSLLLGKLYKLWTNFQCCYHLEFSEVRSILIYLFPRMQGPRSLVSQPPEEPKGKLFIEVFILTSN